jgi:dethiobiotin synthetase
LARHLARQGVRVGVFKPVASGGRVSEDGKLLQKGAGLPDASYSSIVPVHYLQPLAPYPASWKEGEVSLSTVEKAYQKMKKFCDFLIVEGIGGALVPITRKFFVTDWMVKWKMPALVVARAGLGTINHTLLTVEALQRRKIQVAGVLINGFTGKTPAEKTNLKALRNLLDVPVFGPLRHNPKYRTNLDLLSEDLKKLDLDKKVLDLR